MKILYHHRIASKDGQYVHVEEMVKAFRRLGHEIIMVAPSVAENKEFGSEGGFVKSLKQHLPKAMYELMELAYSVIAYLKLAKAIKQHRPDVIYERYNLFLPAGVWAKKKFKLPFLLEVNAPLFDERKKYDGIALKRLAHWSESYAWRNADIALPVTQVLANRVMQESISADKIRVIHNGIDTDKFGNVPDAKMCKKELGLEGRLVLGFTGFVRDWHGLDKVVELLPIDNGEKRHLLVVGDGPARAAIEQRAAELGVSDQVTITGIVGRDRIPAYVSAFDIALQPDVVDYASPLKMFEYLALGRAIVAPDKDNIKEILEHEKNGYLFEADDTAAFLKATEYLCQDDVLRQRLAQQARETISQKNYTWLNNAKVVTGLFESLLEKHGSD